MKKFRKMVYGDDLSVIIAPPHRETATSTSQMTVPVSKSLRQVKLPNPDDFDDYQLVDLDYKTGAVTETKIAQQVRTNTDGEESRDYNNEGMDIEQSAESFLKELELYKTLPSLHHSAAEGKVEENRAVTEGLRRARERAATFSDAPKSKEARVGEGRSTPKEKQAVDSPFGSQSRHSNQLIRRPLPTAGISHDHPIPKDPPFHVPPVPEKDGTEEENSIFTAQLRLLRELDVSNRSSRRIISGLPTETEVKSEAKLRDIYRLGRAAAESADTTSGPDSRAGGGKRKGKARRDAVIGDSSQTNLPASVPEFIFPILREDSTLIERKDKDEARSRVKRQGKSKAPVERDFQHETRVLEARGKRHLIDVAISAGISAMIVVALWALERWW